MQNKESKTKSSPTPLARAGGFVGGLVFGYVLTWMLFIALAVGLEWISDKDRSFDLIMYITLPTCGLLGLSFPRAALILGSVFGALIPGL